MPRRSSPHGRASYGFCEAAKPQFTRIVQLQAEVDGRRPQISGSPARLGVESAAGSPMGRNSSSALVHQTVAIARAQLADLMAELEAGARFVDRIERDASALDDRLRTNLHQRDEMERLIGRLGELRDSLTQQRTLMIQLRGCFDVLRRALTTRL